ncbi:unnamed protein product [Calypogeia fissa]
MPPAQRSTRINLQDIKSKFLKILGPAKENQYWSLLSSFLSFKLTKAELDKLVPSTIGKENVVLHNQLVRAIYFNATCSDAPAPPPSVHDTSKPVKGIRRKPLVTPSSVPTDEPGPVSPVPVVRANGDGAVPSSPRKGRSAINRDRKAKERPSPLGFHSRGEASTSRGASALDQETSRSLENGSVKMPDLSRPAQQSPYPAEHSNLELTSPNKRPRLTPTAPGNNVSQLVDGNSGMGQPRQDCEDLEENEDEEDEDNDNGAVLLSNRFVKAPLGIPFCVASVGAPRRVPFMGLVGPIAHTLLGDSIDDGCLEESELPDAEGMQRRMQQIAVMENSLEGVSPEAANLLNNALDVYLKSLIKPAIELRRARRSSTNREKKFGSKENGGIYLGKDLRKDGSSVISVKQTNGTWPVHISRRDGNAVGGESAASEDADKFGSSVISALDFKVAMDINPQLLGEEWPTLMEKIALRVFEQ